MMDLKGTVQDFFFFFFFFFFYNLLTLLQIVSNTYVQVVRAQLCANHTTHQALIMYMLCTNECPVDDKIKWHGSLSPQIRRRNTLKFNSQVSIAWCGQAEIPSVVLPRYFYDFVSKFLLIDATGLAHLVHSDLVQVDQHSLGIMLTA